MSVYRTNGPLVLLMCGDVESNPGPARGGHQSQSQTGRPVTRQSTLESFSMDRRTSIDQPRSPLLGGGREPHQSELFAFLAQMKTDLSIQNKDVMTEVKNINTKIDNLAESVQDLKTENEQLKQSNADLQSQLSSVASKLDYLEGQSRRNNLRFNGIHGRVDEDWDVTEEKVRSFIKNEIEMPGHESVEIERAHRLKSSDRNKCTIIVKFTKFKDREAILRKASDIFDHESPFSVQADYTQRVKKHRRELGKEMIAARQNGQNAKIQYDKLVIDNKVYRYDDARETSVLVRDNNRQPRGYSARGSLYMGSADFRRHLGQPHGTANQNDSGSVNGDEARANDSARNESEALGGATGGDDGNLGEVY